MEVKIIAEIGINHNGSLDIAKKLIDTAKVAGFTYVKFQKRDVDLCIPKEQRDVMRDTPWGRIPYYRYREYLEFGKDEYDEIDAYCRINGMKWFASAWDVNSIDFLKQYGYIVKIPSAKITDSELISKARTKFNVMIMSTGMSTQDEIDHAVELCHPEVIMACNSAYPAPVNELDLGYIRYLKDRYKYVAHVVDGEYGPHMGYSGHDYGLVTTFAAVALGAKWIERHVTLDRTMYGSDQLSSIEPIGMIKLCKGIHDVESALGGYCDRTVHDSELEKRKSLRGS